MAKSSSKPKSFSNALSLAKPAGKSVEQVEETPSGFDRVIQEAGASSANDAPKPVQRSREGMAKMTIHMSPEARKLLRGCAMRNEEGQEEFVLTAINERLAKLGEDFQVG